jgi:hypothetical protein
MITTEETQEIITTFDEYETEDLSKNLSIILVIASVLTLLIITGVLINGLINICNKKGFILITNIFISMITIE